MQSEDTQEPYDAIVIGSGFGGAVTAARLVEAGLAVCLLERGRRFDPGDFPDAPSPEQVLPDMARWRWAPRGGEHGLWETRDLGDLLSVQAAGYGGGSLIYANVHLRAPEEAFRGWPEGWSRAALDPYYDLVARRIGLEVAPDAIRDPRGTAQPIRKAEQMKRASAELGRPWVKLPLAVRFGDEGATATRGRCVGCGACDTGCSYGAKKTLDQNYLEVVDRAANEARPDQRVAVYTLAEAIRIEPGADSGVEGFTVHYRDHLTLEGEYGRGHAPVRVLRAKHVFVCAGALGSTELLGRSVHEDLQGLNTERLGAGFRANVDSLGVVYDTAEEQRPDVGPTITGGMLYQGPSVLEQHGVVSEAGDDLFLMVQDGGYSLPVAGGFQAVFRSPLWFGRNRFDDRPADQRGAPFGAGGPLGALTLDLPTGGRANAALPVALFRVLVANQLSPELRRILREQGERWTAMGDEVYERENSALLDAIFAQMVEEMPRILEDRYDAVRSLFRFAPSLRAMTQERTREILAAAKPTVSRVFRKAGVDRFGLGDLAHLAATTVRLAAGDRSASYVVAGGEAGAGRSEESGQSGHGGSGRRAADHLTVLLSMGRDQGAGKVTVDSPEDGGRTRVTLDLPRGVPAYATQEALLRDVAQTMRGELRVNPDWSTNRRPVTVHAQGGCAMADDASGGVTDAQGAVYGVPGLYVFDASAFPTSVGVNPSHTIAAMAERNVETFLAAYLEGDAKAQWALTREAEKRQAREWVAAFEAQGHAIDPLKGALTARSAGPRAEPVGLKFDETMVGFVAPVDRGALATVEDAVAVADIELGPYLAAQHRGRGAGTSLQLDLTATARDLRYFMDRAPHEMQLTGTARFVREGDTGLEPTERPVVGTLELMGAATAERRTMKYTVFLADEAGRPRTAEPWLRGFKEVSDDVGADAYADTTTLYVSVTEGGAQWGGVIRVPLDEFVEKQLPSMEVFGTTDPAARAWALAEFGGFFFGHLVRAYGADALAVAKSVGRRWTAQARAMGLIQDGGER